jgi:phage regulator Rha-like protein
VNELVAIKKIKGKENAFTNSIIVANGTGNQHHSVTKLIRRHKKRFERWGDVEFMDFKSINSKRGRPIKIAMLNEEQAYFLITLLDNNETVADFKAELVDQFFKAKKLLAEKQTETWKLTRGQGKEVRREFTDAIQEYKNLAISQGHEGTAKWAYSNLTNLVKKPFGTRDNAETAQLLTIAAVEHVLAITLLPMVRAGMDASEIYRVMKDKAHALTGVMLPALPQCISCKG